MMKFDFNNFKNYFLKSDYVTKHNVIKVVSLLLAVVVWFYLRETQDVQLTRTAAVSVKVGEGMGVVSKSVDAIKMEIKGNKDEVEDMRDKHIVAQIDLTKYSGKKTLEITKEKIKFLNLGYTNVLRIWPSTIEIEVDRLVEKILPVKVEFSGKPNEDYMVHKIYINPKEVKIKGPETRIKKLQEIKTLPLDLTGRVGDFTEMIALQRMFSDEKLKLVNVHVTVKEKLTPREFNQIPINIFTSTAQNLDVQLSTVSANVKVVGSKEAIAKLTPDDIKLFIVVAGLAPGTYELPIQMIGLKDIKLELVDPSVIDLTIGASIKE